VNLGAPVLDPRTPTASTPPGTGDGRRVCALLAGLGGALVVRVELAGPAGVRSASAGLVFAVVLLTLAVAGSVAGAGSLAVGPVRRQVAVGLGGAAVLSAVPLVVHLRTPGGPLPLAELPVWAAVVTAVAVAEETFLRGALWTATQRWRGEMAALTITTLAFGLLHVPLYGWAALPLDVAVGLLLGGLRMATGGWGAPAIAHVLADLAGWWLR
jgi:membrane protease YdiL (CAAX protease family)